MAKTTRTISEPEMGSTETSLGTKVEHQPLDGDDAASLSGTEGCAIEVADIPGGAAQFGPAVGAGRDGLGGHRHFTDQAVDVAPVVQAETREDRLAEQAQADERENWEQQPLDPRRSRGAQQHEDADDQGAGAEEDD